MHAHPPSGYWHSLARELHVPDAAPNVAGQVEARATAALKDIVGVLGAGVGCGDPQATVKSSSACIRPTEGSYVTADMPSSCAATCRSGM
jgi:hypothetical protein